MQSFLEFLGFRQPDSAAVEARPRSSPRRPKVIIPVKLERGGLSKFGYYADNTVRSRHNALLRGARSEGFLPIIQRLNLIATFSRYRSPHYSKIFKSDQEWLSAHYKVLKDNDPSLTEHRRSRSSSPVRQPTLSSPKRSASPSRLIRFAPLSSPRDDDDWSEDDDMSMDDGSY